MDSSAKNSHRHRHHFHIPFFRIFYSTTYTAIYILTIVMLCVNPAVMIYTAFDQGTYQYVFEIGGVYILTALLAIFIYLSRLFTNRTVMAAVGKSWIPIEDGEVGKKIRKMITRALERTATIALEARPHDLSSHLVPDTACSTEITDPKEDENFPFYPPTGRILHLDPHCPPWGHIKHPGWSSPSPIETNLAPHVQFRTVVLELPNLVEAKAVSLAPPDPYATPTAVEGTVLADPLVVEILRRKPNADLRSYLAHLSRLGILDPPEAGEDFLWQYERARFSCDPLSEDRFEGLMASFALLLTGMQEPSKTIVGKVRATGLAGDSVESLSISSSSASSLSSSSRSTSIAGSVRRSLMRPSATTPSLYKSVTGSSYDTAPILPFRSHIPGAFSPRTENLDDTPRLQTANTYFSTPLSAAPLRREPSRETFGSIGSVLRTHSALSDGVSTSSSSLRSRSLRSYAGSVIRHSPAPGGHSSRHGWVPPG